MQVAAATGSHRRSEKSTQTPVLAQAIRTYLQQQRAWGRVDFRALVESKTDLFAATDPRMACAPDLPLSKRT